MAKHRKNSIWIILGVVTAIGVASFILFYLNRNTVVPASWGNTAGVRNGAANWLNLFQQAILTPIITAVLGIMIVQRYPKHRVGWLLVAISSISVTAMLVAELTVYGYFTVAAPLEGIVWVAWVNNWLWAVLYSVSLYMVAIFPDGNFLSHRWRITLSIMLVWFTLPIIAGSALESPMSSAYQIPNPLNLDSLANVSNVLFNIGLPAMPITALSLVVSAVVRFRRGQGRERQQMKWLLGGVSLLAFMLVVGLAFSSIEGFAIGEIVVNASMLGPVFGIGAALLRHQLYDIDIIIRRTLVYAVVSALLAVIYFGSVVVLQGLITAVGGQQSGVVVVVSTLVIAALFNPVRRQVQSLVDHRFYRQKYNAAQTLNRFAVAARDEVDMGKLSRALVDVVQETMQPEKISLWLKNEPPQW